MAFRFLLVGFVAALGFDMPKGIEIDVESWTDSGRAWWHARASEIEARHGIALVGIGDQCPDSATIDEPEAPPPNADDAFATVIEDVVSAFAEDGIFDVIEEPDASSQLVAGVDDAAFGPDYADALNRGADGLSEPAEPVSLVDETGEIESDQVVEPLVVSISGVAGSAFAAPVESVRDDQRPEFAMVSTVGDSDVPDSFDTSANAEPGLVKAFQLTGQALQAWLALVQPAP